jgi:hypothetical protein
MTPLPRFPAKAFTSSAAGCDNCDDPATKTMLAPVLPEAGIGGAGVGAGGGGDPAADGRGGGPAGRAGCG